MQYTKNTQQLLRILLVVSWIIFVGVCIEAGGFLTNAIFALANPSALDHLYHQVDLSDLQHQNTGHFFTLISIMTIVAVLRAILFYNIIRILHDKSVTIAQPFNEKIRRFINRGAGISLLIGLASAYGAEYATQLSLQAVRIPDTQALRLGGADVWIFMSITLFVIALILKKGIEIQTENDLTI